MTAEIETARYAVEVRGVHKSYGALEVLKGVDLTVRPGRSRPFSDPPGRASPLCCAR